MLCLLLLSVATILFIMLLLLTPLTFYDWYHYLFCAHHQVNWVPKICTDLLLRGSLPDITVPTSVREVKYCHVSMNGFDIHCSFSVRYCDPVSRMAVRYGYIHGVLMQYCVSVWMCKRWLLCYTSLYGST